MINVMSMGENLDAVMMNDVTYDCWVNKLLSDLAQPLSGRFGEVKQLCSVCVIAIP